MAELFAGDTPSEHAPSDHASQMDGIYRIQRHFYDFSRKYYLLGRDQLIEGLAATKGDKILELGCGTGRNLIMAARRWPDAQFYGLDISTAMLETAQKNIDKAGLGARIRLAKGDATDFDAHKLFEEAQFTRVFCAYSLSMIPCWQRVIAAGLDATAQGGAVHLVDFGDCSELPNLFRKLLYRWLAHFHVAPRTELSAELSSLMAQRSGLKIEWRALYRGYAQIAQIKNPLEICTKRVY